MVYEFCALLRPEAGEEAYNKLKESSEETLKNFNGELVMFEDWGVRQLAQPTEKGIERGRFVYIMYKGDGSTNLELERRCRINEDVMKFIVVKLGKDSEIENFKKSYNNPFDQGEKGDPRELQKERKMFARRRSCWFTANKMRADWKDPNSWSWLTNEFGKITPARVSGISSKHQTFVTSSIKRARCIGLASFVSGRQAR